MKNTWASALLGFAVLTLLVANRQMLAAGLGTFDHHRDIGVTPKTGDAVYDAKAGEYRITGGGANIWKETDAFQYVYRRISGDVTLTADVRFTSGPVTVVMHDPVYIGLAMCAHNENVLETAIFSKVDLQQGHK